MIVITLSILLYYSGMMMVSALNNCHQFQYLIKTNQSLESRNLTISNQPFAQNQGKIIQTAVKNIEYEAYNKIKTINGRPVERDPLKQPQYFLMNFEVTSDNAIEKSIFNMEDKKPISISFIDNKMIVVTQQGIIRLFDSSNLSLMDQFMESKIADVQGIYEFTFLDVKYFAIYGKTLGVFYLKRGILDVLYNQEGEPYQNVIMNVQQVDGKLYYYNNKKVHIVNLSRQLLEKQVNVAEYQQAFIFSLYNNKSLIIPYNSSTSNDNLLYNVTIAEIGNQTKQVESYRLYNPIRQFSQVNSIYLGTIVFSLQNDSVLQVIQFDENNVQMRESTDESQNLQPFQHLQYLPKQLLIFSQNLTHFTQTKCSHCKEDKFLFFSQVSSPQCKQCGYQCQSCLNDQKCTLCQKTYFIKEGMCQCSLKFYEDEEQKICIKIEETDPLIKVGIGATIFLIGIFYGSVRYMQYKEKKRIEQKEKLFKSSLKEDDEIFNRDAPDEDDDDEEDEENNKQLEQHNVTALFDKANNKNSNNNSFRDKLNSSRTNRSSTQQQQLLNDSKKNNVNKLKTGANKSFAKPKSMNNNTSRQAVGLDDLDQKNIHPIREEQDDDDDDDYDHNHDRNSNSSGDKSQDEKKKQQNKEDDEEEQEYDQEQEGEEEEEDIEKEEEIPSDNGTE